MSDVEFEITDNSGEAKAAMTDAVKQALEAMGQQAEGYAKGLCPVDTGRLRSSITHEVQDKICYIGTNVEYAEAVETDDRKRHKNGQAHYLKRGVSDHVSEYQQIANSYIKGG